MLKQNLIMGREPAVFFGLVAAILLAIVQLVGLTDPVAGAANAVILAAAGVATALLLEKTDAVLPTIVGLVQAVFALLLAYGSPLPESTQTGILALITAGAAFFVRQNVTAPVSGRSSLDAVNDAWHLGREAGSDEAYDRGLRDGAANPDAVQLPQRVEFDSPDNEGPAA
jgi:hypothetical protein